MDLEKVKKKDNNRNSLERLYNEQFKNQIEIDKNQIIEDLEKLTEKVDNLLLSEIIFTINKKKN